MTSSNGEESAILFKNEEKTAFLIDIPRSIALAQDLSPSPSSSKHGDPSQTETSTSKKGSAQRGRRIYLISNPPRQTPYPSTEPKSQSARAKVLQMIPVSERRFHGEFVQPLVRSALEDIHSSFRPEEGQWCLPRRVLDVQARQGGKRKWEGNSPQQPASPGRDAVSQILPVGNGRVSSEMTGPPVVLSSSSVNMFESESDLDGIVKNPSFGPVILTIGPCEDNDEVAILEYIVPPQSTFLLCTVPLTDTSIVHPIPGLPTDQKFNLILFDPPWPNRSVRRSSQYDVHPRTEMELLTSRLQDILRVYSFGQPGHYAAEQCPSSSLGSDKQQYHSQVSLAAIWITNSEKARRTAYDALTTTGFRICEEWIWVKITAGGQPISPLDGLWRRPYEILVIGRKGSVVHGSQSQATDLLGIDPSRIKRRVIAAVPDLHSRKPNLKAVFEEIFFRSSSAEQVVDSYSALEVFARNLTAGWWACGNEVLKFNARECWIEEQ